MGTDALRLAAAHFYPRSPCGERPICSELLDMENRYFYPRSPCGERQEEKTMTDTKRIISIHALLAESDSLFCPLPYPYRYFYPRSPCGERRQ